MQKEWLAVPDLFYVPFSTNQIQNLEMTLEYISPGLAAATYRTYGG